MSTITRFSQYKIMWIMIFFDLPTETKTQKKQYTDFRKYLLSDGFFMFQFSIYARHCFSKENTDMHIKRVTSAIPPEGKVCIMTLTDRQFSEIKLFEGYLKPTPPSEQADIEYF